MSEARPTLFQLFSTFLRIGLFTIGGGYAMLAMVRQMVVVRRKWMNEDEFVELIALLQSLPGVFAVNTALTAGLRMRGRKGSLVAACGAILPSIVIVLLIAIVGETYKSNPVVEACFKGIRPCVTALILSPAVQMIRKSGVNLRNFLIPVAAVLLITLLHVPPVYIILAAGSGGALYGLYRQRKEAAL